MKFADLLAYLVNIGILGYVTFYLNKKIKDYYLGKYFLPGLLFKVVAGITVGLIYTHYYRGGDTYTFFSEAVNLTNIAYSNPIDYLKIVFVNDIPSEFDNLLSLQSQPRAFFTAKLASFTNILTYNNYWLSGIYFSYFSFLGMWYLANMLATKFENTKKYTAFAFLFFPSVVFWSSGLSKESIVMGCISFIIGFSIPYLILSKNIYYPKIVLIAFFLWMLLKLKYYYVGVLIPVMAANFIVAYIRFNFKAMQRSYAMHLGVWLLSFGLVLGLATTIHPNLHISSFLGRMVETHNQIYEKSAAEDLVTYNKLEPSLKSVAINLPLALYTGLFRPSLIDASSTFQIAVGIENLLLVFLTIGALFRIFKKPKFSHRILIFSVVVYVFILATFMALSSPNFGTLVRYKIAFLPFFIYLISVNNPIIDKALNRLKPLLNPAPPNKNKSLA